MLQSKAANQKDLNMLEKWPNRYLMKFSTGNCRAMHLGWNHPLQKIQKGLESSSAEDDLWVLVDKLNRSQQCALAARKTKHLLGRTNINIDKRLRAELVPLFLALARLLPVQGFQAEDSL